MFWNDNGSDKEKNQRNMIIIFTLKNGQNVFRLDVPIPGMASLPSVSLHPL